jgi:release factor glutamine methyltransferase
MSESTVLDVLNKTSDYFKQKGIANARLDAQLILAHCLGMKRLDLYLNFDRPLSETDLAKCREAVRRRASREPLQHILGVWPFRELTLKVDKRALIPRQETEALVEHALKALSATAPEGEPLTAVDIGLGTGAIALSLMKERGNLHVYGTEVSPDALALCRENAAHCGLDASRFALGSLFEPLPPDLRFDLIISNPPYIGDHELQDLQPEVRDFDPRLALVGGAEGWELPWRLIVEAHTRLKPGGLLFVEVAPDQIPILLEKVRTQNWAFCGFEKDWSENPRFIHMRR